MSTNRKTHRAWKRPGRASDIAGSLLVLLLVPALANAQFMDCGSLENAYGPYDYTNPSHFANNLPRVEAHHFTRDIEHYSLSSMPKNRQARLGADIDYTLRAFPNHHRALYTMAKYHLDGLDRKLRPMRYSVDCYFERARRFRPNDATVYMIHGIYLAKLGRTDASLAEYSKAVELEPRSAEARYNYALALLADKQYEAASIQARESYAIGFPLDGLKKKLKRVGHWPPPPAPAAPDPEIAAVSPDATEPSVESGEAAGAGATADDRAEPGTPD